jgi:hypothetical protein
MDFIILLGFKMIFNFLWPEPKTTHKQAEPSTEAAFWFGTSYENLDQKNNGYKDRFESTQNNESYSQSDYENIW